jgi:hypothetical protein
VNNVIKINLTNSLFAASLLLASPLVAAETQYPAADFQPKVVFQDAEQIAQHGKSGPSTSTSSESAAAVTDAKYPAANFQPKVLYKDENYQPSPSSSPVSTAAPTPKASRPSPIAPQESVQTESVKKDTTDTSKPSNNWVVLIILAIAGVIFFSRRSKSGAEAQAGSGSPVRASYADATGLTGVDKYINKTTGTSVSRYLEKQVKTEKPATGVSKYLAQQAVSSKGKSSEAVTGVEKYMRNRG